jgi:hypothetical protein
MHPAIESILQHFRYDHLPEPLQEVSKDFHTLANKVAARKPDNPETTVALRKLLEAKDAAVRACVQHETVQQAAERGFKGR